MALPIKPSPVVMVSMPAPADKPKSTWAKIASRSKSFWMQLNAVVILVFGFITDFGNQGMEFATKALGVAPAVSTDVQSFVDTSSQFAGWVQTDIKKYMLPLVAVSIAIAMVRHVNDKKGSEQ